jgi:adenylate cyclase
MLARLKKLNNEWKDRNFPILKCRIGINTGSMIIGNMGARDVFDYTVLGDEVNLAAKLGSINKYYQTNLIKSEATFKNLTKNTFRTRKLDIVKVKGKTRPVNIYEVYSTYNDVIEPKDFDYYNNYENALKYYCSQDFKQAQKSLDNVLFIRNNDFVSLKLQHKIL